MLINNKEITIQYVNLYDFFGAKQIGIPIFQRFYAWKTDTTEQLLEDLNQAIVDEDKELYLLDFIYYLDNGNIMLADGQQRLVTLNLLIKAINDVAMDQNINIGAFNVFDIHYDIEVNDTKYQNSFVNYPVAPFKKVYMHLRSYVERHIHVLEKLVNIIKKRIFIYAKKCIDAEEAFLIFQQINTGGKPLTKEDIIKTAIDEYAKAYNIPINTKKIREIKIQLESYYRYLNENSTADFDNVTIMSFIKDSVTKSPETFREFVNTIELLRRLESNPLTKIFKYIKRTSLMNVLNILTMKGIDVFEARHRAYLDKVIMPLCLMSIVLSLNGGNPTVFKYLLNEIIPLIKSDASIDDLCDTIAHYAEENQLSCKISFETFVNAIGDPSTPINIKKALLIMDVINSSVSSRLDVDNINLEHIYPQKPAPEWSRHGWPGNLETSELYINNIGNYILLYSTVNKSISNKYISDKVVQYKDIMRRDTALQTAMNSIDFNEFETRKMNYIVDRQRHIAELVRDTLPFGDVLIVTE